MPMKKALIWLLLFTFVLPIWAFAQENTIICQPGNVFEAVFALTADSITPDAMVGELEFDHDVFEPVLSSSLVNQNGRYALFIYNGNPASVSFRVNKFAPSDTYTISVKVLDSTGKTNQVKITPVQVRIGPAPTQPPTSTPLPTPTPQPTPASVPIICSSENSQPIDIGDIVQFGHYEQDGNISNGTEPIEWYILDIDDEGILLISLYSLDTQPYNTINTGVNWETSSIRAWLNGEFYDSAFSAEEKTIIVDTQVYPAKNMSSQSQKPLDQGKATLDKVFLLSQDEWSTKYREMFWKEKVISGSLVTGKVPLFAPKTNYAIQKASGNNDEEQWWLRGETLGNPMYSALAVSRSGAPVNAPINDLRFGIRPLLHIKYIDTAHIKLGSSQLSFYPTPTPTVAPKLRSFASIDDSSIGSTIDFGTYEQDGDTENGKEPIEWIILSIDGKKTLLLSKYALDAQPFNETYADVTWENCSLRSWLNKEFYESAFNKQERECIVLTTIDNGPSQNLTNPSPKADKNTKDRVFLLSNKEAIEDYKDVLQLNPCKPTIYAEHQGVYTWNGYFSWKLRTPWPNNCFGLLQVEDSDGKLYVVFNEESNGISGGIRPAIWIDTSLASKLE